MKPFARCFKERILQFTGGRKSHRVDQNVEFTSKGLTGPGKRGVELLVALHITRKDRRIRYLGSKLAHILLHTILVGNGQASAFSGKSLGNGPANRTMVCYAKNKRVFSFK